MPRVDQADAIKVAAVVTAMPRWIGALLAAEGFAIPQDWLWIWVPASALFGAAMALVEGLAFAYVFNAWRNQTDKRSNRLLWLALLSAAIFVIVLAPYIAAQVRSDSLSAILANDFALYAWSAAVAASTIAIVASVGYAQRMPRRTQASQQVTKSGKQMQPTGTHSAECDLCDWSKNGYKSARAAKNAVIAHQKIHSNDKMPVLSQ